LDVGVNNRGFRPDGGARAADPNSPEAAQAKSLFEQLKK
jgi:hypothetical protein